MSYEEWLKRIRLAEKTSVLQGRVRKVHYKFAGGQEMAEEYSMDTGMVTRRVWKRQRSLIRGATEPEWTIELGDVVRQLNPTEFEVKESIAEPVITKRVTRHIIEWRIRNLPYPIEMYTVSPALTTSAGPSTSPAIVVRTINKKYYKRIEVPELERCNLPADQSCISLHHQYNTLVITYKKPALLSEMEKAVLLELQNVVTEDDTDVESQDLFAKLMAVAGCNGDGMDESDAGAEADAVKLDEIRYC